MVNCDWEGVEDGFLGLRRRAIAGDDEGDREIVVVDDSLGELGEWDEVAHARTRKNCDVRWPWLCLRHVWQSAFW